MGGNRYVRSCCDSDKTASFCVQMVSIWYLLPPLSYLPMLSVLFLSRFRALVPKFRMLCMPLQLVGWLSLFVHLSLQI